MSRRRARGEGSIVLRKDGRYMLRWIDHEGKHRTAYARTESDAARALRQAITRVEDGIASVESSDSFKAHSDRFLLTAETRHGLTKRTIGTYRSALKNHAYPVIGAVKMRNLRASHIVAVLDAMQEKKLSTSYRNITLKAISGVCREAIADGDLRVNPVRLVKAPKVKTNAAKVVPSREQVTALIEAAPNPRARILIVTLAHTGLRLGEALSLQWSDWDGSGTLRVMKTKGDKPRAVPVTKALAAELTKWRAIQATERLASVWWNTDADLIISSSYGTKWDASNARKNAFRPVVEGDPEKGIEGICPGATPHSLRHAAATILLEEGVPMKVVSELLGHASTRTTAEVYSHVTARLVAEAGDALGRALG